MKYREPRDASEHRINAEATDWLSKIDRDLTPAEQDEYLQWLAADPRHREWIAMQRRAWEDFDLLSEWRPEHSKEPNPDLLAKPSGSRKWLRWGAGAGALAACLAVVCSALFFQAWQGSQPESDQIIAVDYRYQELEDGSEIDLKAGAAVVVDYGPEERRVRLVSGEAHFTVDKDPARPFVVLAGDARVRAVGTAFNVRLDPNSVEVLVAEGKVRVEAQASRGVSSPETSESTPSALDLEMGQRSRVWFEEDGPSVATDVVDSDEMERLLAWKPVVLDFDSKPLEEVIEAFNRRNETKFFLASESLSRIRIAASFRSNNIEGFARMLELGFGLEIDRSERGKLVVRERA